MMLVHSVSRRKAILEAEISVIIAAMKRGNLTWSSRSSGELPHANLLAPFFELRKMVSTSNISFSSTDPNFFLSPFLDVIRSEVVTGPVTGLALTSVNKFIVYGLLEENQANVSSAVENLADAVTHARFVGVDPSSDEIVLMKIVHVLRTLLLSPIGSLLTNESVCEVLQSTFRICFETRLSELLRKTADHVLTEMIQHLFSRLPTFSEESLPLLKKLKMRNTHHEGKSRKRHPRSSKANVSTDQQKQQQQDANKDKPETGDYQSKAITTSTSKEEAANTLSRSSSVQSSLPALSSPVSDTETISNSPSERKFDVDTDVLARSPCGSVSDLTVVDKPGESQERSEPSNHKNETEVAIPAIVTTTPKGTEQKEINPESLVKDDKVKEYVNAKGVTFTPTADMVDDTGSFVPYGLPCVRELFRFLISLINPYDAHNGSSMIQISLSLLSTALEIGADHLDKFDSLLVLVKDELARNLVSLLSSERLGIFSSALWLNYLIYESQRKHLKYQLEIFFQKLIEVIYSESHKVTYEQKELALETIVKFFRVPGFITQLYLNFDCDLYTSNLFEDVSKLLSKNAFPVNDIQSTHRFSLEALLTVIGEIELECNKRMAKGLSSQHIGANASDNERRESFTEQGTKTENPSSIALPTHEEVMALKHKKKLITTATEQFNSKPAKGISHMQESKLLKTPLDPEEVANFIRHNPHLSKKQIGEYISNRKNLPILEAFVKSFDFINLRIDESLRQFLEAFRLPGEAPLITLILEHFADHWHKTAGRTQGVKDSDSAFTLSYAIIMLNVDQHNKNHTKTNDPMTEEQFIRNLRGTNGGGDHDVELLQEIYHAIRSEEIVMPAEQTGIVKENYLWKCTLKRGQEENSALILVPNGYFDHDLFAIVWSPTIAALSYVFDKGQYDSDVNLSLSGFQRCATISAYYNINEVFDHIVISLSKFSTLPNTSESPYQFVPIFGANQKALIATKMLFSLVLRHGDVLRDGWKNVLDCLIQLFKCQLLPQSMMEAEDFIAGSGRVFLYQEGSQEGKTEAGFLNSFVSFISMASDMQQRIRTPEEEEWARHAAKAVNECHLSALSKESKFFHAESLKHLIKATMVNSFVEDADDQNARAFSLEFMVQVCIQNKDRALTVWQMVFDHLVVFIKHSIESKNQFMLDRTVTALLRLCVRLSRKEELTSTLIQSLNALVALPMNSVYKVSRHVAFGLYELLRSNAANIHEASDWSVIFALMELIGVGAKKNLSGTSQEDLSSENEANVRKLSGQKDDSGGWIVLEKCDKTTKGKDILSFDDASIIFNQTVIIHDSLAFLKCCESLAFLIRDMAHITPFNFKECVRTLRIFVEAIVMPRSGESPTHHHKEVRSHSKRTPQAQGIPSRKARTAPVHHRTTTSDGEESDTEPDFSNEFHHITLQLLDLMHTLHNRSGQIFSQWDEEHEIRTKPDLLGGDSLWTIAWCPLLQGMARLCCDRRSHIRTQALTTLQRALLFPDLQNLEPQEWENAFTLVLFPMLAHLMTKSNPGEKTAMEETRTRGATLLGKVFLQHLSPLSSLESFNSLWLTILDFMQKFLSVANSDLLADAVPELLKNMLLVMDTAGIFDAPSGDGESKSELWRCTCTKLEEFLPQLIPQIQGNQNYHSNKSEASSPHPEQTVVQPSIPAQSEGAGSEKDEKKVALNLEQSTNEAFKLETSKEMEPPVPSPLEPPYLSSMAFVMPDNNDAGKSYEESVNSSTSIPIEIPSLPEFAPLPPPPVSLTINNNPNVVASTRIPSSMPAPSPIPVIPDQLTSAKND